MKVWPFDGAAERSRGLHITAVVAATMVVALRLLALSPRLALNLRLPVVAAGAGAVVDGAAVLDVVVGALLVDVLESSSSLLQAVAPRMSAAARTMVVTAKRRRPDKAITPLSYPSGPDGNPGASTRQHGTCSPVGTSSASRAA